MKPARRRIEALLTIANRPLYGLEIAQITRTRTGRLYVVLYQLEREGLVRSEWAVPIEPSIPRRRVYEWIRR